MGGTALDGRVNSIVTSTLPGAIREREIACSSSSSSSRSRSSSRRSRSSSRCCFTALLVGYEFCVSAPGVYVHARALC